MRGRFSLRDSRSSLQEVKAPGGSGWRSCAAAPQLLELAAAERRAEKLPSAFLQLAAGGSPLDTAPPRYVVTRPPVLQPTLGRPWGRREPSTRPARGLCRLRGSWWRCAELRVCFTAGVAPAARIPGLGRAALLGCGGFRVLAGGAWGMAAPVGSARGDALGCGRLLHARRHASPRCLLTPAGRAGPFPLGA